MDIFTKQLELYKLDCIFLKEMITWQLLPPFFPNLSTSSAQKLRELSSS